MELNPKKAGRSLAAFLPRPRSLGSFVILLTFLSFTAGRIRGEPALILLGTIFLVVLAYCFAAVLFSGILNRRKALSLSMVIPSKTVPVGGEGELAISSGAPSSRKRFWNIPAVLIRCELCLETKDGRVIRHFVNPAVESFSSFPVKERGAYSSKCDRLAIFDAPGFFSLGFSISQNENPRLLALPHPAEEAIPLFLRSGGTEERKEPHYRKNNELINHRPYVPGDDPRRINWKLYSHVASGELFVREGESEPPPCSRLLILIDTEADSSLYSHDEGRKAVDLLCENALASALGFSSRGMDVLIGYTGGGIAGGGEESAPLDSSQLAAALARPAAISWPASSGELPQAPGETGVLVLALPRKVSGDTSASQSALNKFLDKRQQETELVFIYNAEGRKATGIEQEAARCISFYSGKSGVHATGVIK
jgi:uncharacterized protein (DUF58 family)